MFLSRILIHKKSFIRNFDSKGNVINFNNILFFLFVKEFDSEEAFQ